MATGAAVIELMQIYYNTQLLQYMYSISHSKSLAAVALAGSTAIRQHSNSNDLANDCNKQHIMTGRVYG